MAAMFSERPIRVILLVMSVSIVLFGFAVMWTMNGHGVDESKLSKIKTGSTNREVQQLLGEPTSIDRTAVGESWKYSAGTWCIVSVQFQDDGVVQCVEHDH